MSCAVKANTFELLGPTQHRIGSRSLSQIIDRCPTSIPLIEERVVIHGPVDSHRKLVGLAGLALRHENMWRLVLCDFEHSLTHRSVITIVEISNLKD
jgi:hypothetical protein